MSRHSHPLTIMVHFNVELFLRYRELHLSHLARTDRAEDLLAAFGTKFDAIAWHLNVVRHHLHNHTTGDSQAGRRGRALKPLCLWATVCRVPLLLARRRLLCSSSRCCPYPSTRPLSLSSSPLLLFSSSPRPSQLTEIPRGPRSLGLLREDVSCTLFLLVGSALARHVAAATAGSCSFVRGVLGRD